MDCNVIDVIRRESRSSQSLPTPFRTKLVDSVSHWASVGTLAKAPIPQNDAEIAAGLLKALSEIGEIDLVEERALWARLPGPPIHGVVVIGNWAIRSDDPQNVIAKITELIQHAIVQNINAQLTRPVVGFHGIVEEAKALEQSGRLERGLDAVYEYFDRLLRLGLFDVVDSVLRQAQPSQMTVDIGLTVLTVTLAAADRLKARADFYTRFEKWLFEIGQSDPSLLSGLEAKSI